MTARVFAPAKLNLSLAVLAREASGFHQIETIFCALELADEIDLVIAGDDIVLDIVAPVDSTVAPDLGPVEQNLACRAAALFAEHARVSRGVRMRLTKRIPHGAGLGGGSSDAAAVLTALNRLHGEPLTRAQLLQLGGTLGSDVPFFISGSALALAWGRGDRIAPLPPLPPRPVLLALGHERVATATAYAALSHMRGPGYAAPPALIGAQLTSWEDIARLATNDFEPVMFAQLPQQAAVRAELERSGALCARLTGTGAAVFGVFEDEPALSAARERIATRYADVTLLRTATARR